MTKHTWNHRVMRSKDADGDDFYAIHEVHYEDDKPRLFTLDPVPVSGNSIEELRSTLERMLSCVTTPVLTREDFAIYHDDQDPTQDSKPG